MWQKSHLVQHERTHIRVKPYQCQNFQKKLLSKKLFSKTLKNTYQWETISIQILWGEGCSNQLSWKNAHRRKVIWMQTMWYIHLISHTGEILSLHNQCTNYEERVAQTSSHGRMHTGEKSYECRQCDIFTWYPTRVKFWVCITSAQTMFGLCT